MFFFDSNVIYQIIINTTEFYSYYTVIITFYYRSIAVAYLSYSSLFYNLSFKLCLSDMERLCTVE